MDSEYFTGFLKVCLEDDKKKIIYMFIDEVRGKLGKTISKIILYGSYARGEQRRDSDIDIMILTHLTEGEIRRIENEVYDLAYDYGLEYGLTISVNIKNEEHFNYWLGALPYYDNIKREGVVLAG